MNPLLLHGCSVTLQDKGVYSLGERICGLSMEDWASMAKSQYERLSAVWEHCWKNKYQALIPQVSSGLLTRQLTCMPAHLSWHCSAVRQDSAHSRLCMLAALTKELVVPRCVCTSVTLHV